MEMTRENQLKFIEGHKKRLGVSYNHIELKMAIVPAGTIKDFKKGKLPMRSDLWQKIEQALTADLEQDADSRSAEEIMEAYAYAFKAILNILVQQQLVSARALEQIFTQAHDHYEERSKNRAARAIADLQASVTGEPRGVEQSIIRKLSELVPLGAA
jgi:hypothetical protein